MQEPLISQASPSRRYRRAGLAVLATLLLASVMVGASFSVLGSAKGSVANAAVRQPHTLTVTFTTITFQKEVDRASPVLWQACASRTLIKTATFYILASAGSPDSAIITLTNGYVASCSDSGSSGGGAYESISMNFAKVTYDYTPQGAAAIHMGWNVKANVKA